MKIRIKVNLFKEGSLVEFINPSINILIFGINFFK